jgi:hypothetical protein
MVIFHKKFAVKAFERMDVLRYHTLEPTALDRDVAIAVPVHAFFLGLSSSGSVWMTPECEILALDARGNTVHRKQMNFGSLVVKDGNPWSPFWTNCAAPTPFAMTCIVDGKSSRYCRINLDTLEAHVGPAELLFSAWSPSGKFYFYTKDATILRQQYSDTMRPVGLADIVACAPHYYTTFAANDETCFFEECMNGFWRWDYGRGVQSCQIDEMIDQSLNYTRRLSISLLRAIATKDCLAPNLPTRFHPLVRASDSLCNLAIDSIARLESNEEFARALELLPDERCRVIATGFREWRLMKTENK